VKRPKDFTETPQAAISPSFQEMMVEQLKPLQETEKSPHVPNYRS